MRYDYKEKDMEVVVVRGVKCGFCDYRINPGTVPEGKILYEVGDDCSDGEPARIAPHILVDFLGSIVTDTIIDADEDKTVWLKAGDFIRISE